VGGGGVAVPRATVSMALNPPVANGRASTFLLHISSLESSSGTTTLTASTCSYIIPGLYSVKDVSYPMFQIPGDS
jgi:hypothetical protein